MIPAVGGRAQPRHLYVRRRVSFHAASLNVLTTQFMDRQATMAKIVTNLSINLSTVKGISGLNDIIKAASTAGCRGHYDSDLTKVVTFNDAREYCAVVLPSPGVLRFLADKIEMLA